VWAKVRIKRRSMIVEYAELAAWLGLHRSLLVIVPHPDDETIGCGGLLFHAASAGIECHVAVLTDGAASHPESVSWPRPVRVDVRHGECEAALEVLGVRQAPVFFDLPDGETLRLPRPLHIATATRLADMINRIKPDIVLTTWRREPHCDHRFAFTIANEALATSRHKARLVEYMVWTPITGARNDQPNDDETQCRLLDIEQARDRKIAALHAHRSQLGHVFTDVQEGFTLTSSLIAKMTTRHERYDLGS
jgi:LmbE family N-acetylglucosaminyl deacetylase